MKISRHDIESTVIKAAKRVATECDVPARLINKKTCFFGPKGVFDSLAVVRLIVDLEERFESDHGVKIVLADESAMAAKNSPFRSTEALVERIEKLVGGGKKG